MNYVCQKLIKNTIGDENCVLINIGDLVSQRRITYYIEKYRARVLLNLKVWLSPSHFRFLS